MLKARYGVSHDAESERPVFAAETLYRAGLQQAGLATSDEVSKKIQALVAKNHVRVMESRVELDIPNPGKTLKEFKQGSMDDATCFNTTIDRLETDNEVMRNRAHSRAKVHLDTTAKRTFPHLGLR